MVSKSPVETDPRRFARDLRDWADQQVADLSPGCFAIVMATGIVSNALLFQARSGWSDALFGVNVLAYPALILLTAVRVARFSRAIWSDLVNPRLVFSFFTLVAGTDVFGAGIGLRGFPGAALALWIFALVAWVLLIYFSFAVLTFLGTAHGVDVVHGGWLLAIVGTESLVTLGAAVAPAAGGFGATLFVLIHMLWGVGLGLYGIFITLFAYRIFFFAFKPADITPLLWVVMGAAAITVNAGSGLILSNGGMPFLSSMRPFIDGVTLVMWAWASWWIPLLLLFGIWKHGICHVPLSYTPALWSLVFPLGMYTVASLRFALAADFPPITAVSHLTLWIAVAAWGATAAGFASSSWRAFREFSRTEARCGQGAR